MWCHLLLASLLAGGIHAFGPTPIWWSGLRARSFVLAPASGSTLPTGNMMPAQKLMIRDQAGRMSRNEIPYFAVQSDKTISWASSATGSPKASGLCIEAVSSGGEIGDEVRVSSCTGGPTQLWSVLPWGAGNEDEIERASMHSSNAGTYLLQLEGTNKCLGISIATEEERGSLNGAPIELRECEYTLANSWTFEEPASIAARSPSPRSQYVLAPTLGVLALLGALSFGTWWWRRQTKHGARLANLVGFCSAENQGGVSLTALLGMGPCNGSFNSSFDVKEQEVVPVAMAVSPLPAWATDDSNTDAEPKRTDFSSRPVTRDDVVVKFVRSSGPGGQNVNKLSTKADLRFDVMDAEWLPDEVRLHLIDAEANRINKAGELVVTSDRNRTQLGNVTDALEKLQTMIDDATKAVTPKEEDPIKKKKMAKQIKKANQRRLDDKKKASDKKKQRSAGKRGIWD